MRKSMHTSLDRILCMFSFSFSPFLVKKNLSFLYLCSPYCTYTYKLAERSRVAQTTSVGGGGEAAQGKAMQAPGNSRPPATGDGRHLLVSHYPAICLVSIFTAPFPTRIVFFIGC